MNATALDFDFPVPPASLPEARSLRDDLAGLLGRERASAADFLSALADFDRRRGWEALGHASLFAFLTRELRLSKGAAYLRFTAARLLPAFPEVEAALRRGELCLSAVGELSRVLTPQNRAEVLPRFFGLSSREAREVAAALVPPTVQPRREVITAVRLAMAEVRAHELRPAEVEVQVPAPPVIEAPAVVVAADARPAPRPAPTPQVEPLGADLRRLHLTVAKTLLHKVASAKDALSHARPRATTEEVLEAALDLLLERQARRRGLVRRPRGAKPEAAPTEIPSPPAATSTPDGAPHPDARAIPAAVRRAVWRRDQGRCQHPLDGGGICCETRCLELDHVIPVALGGLATVANLRLACRRHNRAAAARALGPSAAEVRAHEPRATANGAPPG